ncbi:skin secretory protein xP2-like [Salvia splendens]|uniref:skin secretory protein xP2-like n=1 Tax=Salvia splendens TaxID=180675 RepID=UPI001C26C6C7|nr:skin secretory protein xP2-like [Salvia splendens]
MAFLRQQDPTRDWTTALTSFGQTGGVATTSSEAPPGPVSHAAVSVPESAELDAIATHYDSDSEERKKKSSQGKTTPEGSEGTERTPEAEPVVKPIPVRRKLVVKADPKADSPKPQRVSQRCLGKWASSRAKPNTAEDPIEIASEEERATPKKAEGEPVQATDQEDTGVSPVQNEPGTTTEGMAGGPNLTSESGRSAGSEKDEALLQAEEEASGDDTDEEEGGAQPVAAPVEGAESVPPLPAEGTPAQNIPSPASGGGSTSAHGPQPIEVVDIDDDDTEDFPPPPSDILLQQREADWNILQTVEEEPEREEHPLRRRTRRMTMDHFLGRQRP